jgi:hypothetical protein
MYRLSVASPSGQTFSFGPVTVAGHPVALPHALLPITPNPAEGTSSVAFTLPSRDRVRLSVLDLQGRQLAVLASGEFDEGRHEALWNAVGSRPGLYFVRLEWPGGTAVRRLVLQR